MLVAGNARGMLVSRECAFNRCLGAAMRFGRELHYWPLHQRIAVRNWCLVDGRVLQPGMWNIRRLPRGIDVCNL